MEFLRFLILAVILAFAAAQLPIELPGGLAIPGLPIGGGETTAAPAAERFSGHSN